jgi:hypothetical protein
MSTYNLMDAPVLRTGGDVLPHDFFLTGIFSLINSNWSNTGTQDCQESNTMPNIGTEKLE